MSKSAYFIFMTMSRIRERSKKLSQINAESPQPSKIGKRREKQKLELLRSLLLQCIYVFIFVVMLVCTILFIGYCNAPFAALPITDYTKEIELVGKFEINERLSKGTKVLGLIGPDSLEEDENGNLYTSLGDGRIVRIAPTSDGIVGKGSIFNVTDGKLENIAKLPGEKHGRPFGLRLIDDILFVADAHAGVYSVDVESSIVTSLVSPYEINPRLGLTDDLCISKDRKFLYFTDGSSKYTLKTVMSYMLEGLCDGRVLRYNMETKETLTMISGLCFANGIQLSNDEKVLFVIESLRYRLRIIDIATWNTKKFIVLPMSADNIRPTGKGTYWIAGASPWSLALQTMQKYAFLRQIIAGFFSDDVLFKSLTHNHNMVVEMNEDGVILQTLHDQTATLTKGLTQATTLKDGRLALGSWVTNWLAFTESKIDPIGEL